MDENFFTNIERRNVLSDEQLVVLAKENDRDATLQLISQYTGAIEARAKSFANANSDDLIQEGLLGFLKAIQTFNPEKNVKFSTYSMVCVKNRMISVFNKDKNKSEEEYTANDDVYDEADIPENIVVEKEVLIEIYDKIISALTDLELRVFQLYLSGLVYNQIALKLDVSAKVVDNAMQRVRRKLKSVLR